MRIQVEQSDSVLHAKHRFPKRETLILRCFFCQLIMKLFLIVTLPHTARLPASKIVFTLRNRMPLGYANWLIFLHEDQSVAETTKGFYFSTSSHVFINHKSERRGFGEGD